MVRAGRFVKANLVTRGLMTDTTEGYEDWHTAADPEALAVLLAAGFELDPDSGIQAFRDRVTQLLDELEPVPLPAGVVRVDATVPSTGLPLRIFTAEGASTSRAIVWIHGGGLITGEPRQDDLLCAELAAVHQCPVVAVAYRLAPEHPYPRGLEDCYAALAHVLTPENGSLGPISDVVLCGASAGGGLAAALAMLARDRGLAHGCAIRGLMLYYPMLDDRPGLPSMERATIRLTWHREMNELAWRSYLGDLTDVPAYAAPARATTEELRGLPPTFIDVGTLDAFLDEDIAFALRLGSADVPVELVLSPGAFHASELFAPATATSRRILQARHDARRRMLAD
jgi:acetyl esterase/lipase